MHLLRSVYLHASKGCPEATPAGIIAVAMPDDVDLTCCAEQIATEITSLGVWDDAAFQLGFTREDADLVRGSEDNEQFSYIVSHQILPNYQWKILKQSASFPIAEHSFSELTDAAREF